MFSQTELAEKANIAPGNAFGKILFFLPSLVAGGAELHTVKLIERIRAEGGDCLLLVYGSRQSSVVAQHPGASGALMLNLKGMSDLHGWISIWRIFRQFKPDIIATINQGPLIVSLVEKFFGATKAKNVCIFHTTEMQEREAYQGVLLKWLAPFTDLIIYVARNQKLYWEEKGVRPRRARVILNGIDLERYVATDQERAQARAMLGLALDETVLGIVASYRVEKNHGELVRALAIARKNGSKVKVISVGDGPKRPETERLAAELGLQDAFIFLGERGDAPTCIKACDAGILCSTAESLPLAGLEFLASGVPMIVSSIRALSEIVEPGVNGLVYKLGDVDALAQAICEIEKPEKRRPLAEKARESVKSFSTSNMLAAYREEFLALRN
jgi:glycosyltransferase involved in cell wall biosynthesis